MLTVISILVGLARPVFVAREFNKHVAQSYQALAHILVGWLLYAWLIVGRNDAKYLLAILTLIEVACATATVVRKLRPAGILIVLALLLTPSNALASEAEELALSIAIYNYNQNQKSAPIADLKLKPLGIQWRSISEAKEQGETVLVLFADPSKKLETLLDEPKVARAFNHWNCVWLEERDAAVWQIKEFPKLMVLNPDGSTVKLDGRMPMDPKSLVNLLTPN